ncbi:MAG: hypothetical protein ABUL60_28775 [Myxococcales bacterium]
MVMPQAMASSCPQCGADVRTSGARCKSCGFWLPAAPARRTGPPTARPAPWKDDSRRTMVVVLSVGAFVVLGLVAAGSMLFLRRSQQASAPPPVAAALTAATAPAPPPRLEPGVLLAAARREASAWHRDAVFVGMSMGPLDARGVAVDGKVEITFAKPSGHRIVGGAEASNERLVLSSRDGTLTKSEERTAKARIAPEPNCLFEDAWSSAQRAGADAKAGLSLRYGWNDKQGRPIWEVVGDDGQVLRRLDGVSCSILTR